MDGQRWATFDCYGTLIDWNSGIRGQFERLFGVQEAPRLLERYHELEPEIESESEPFHTYREVLTLALERLAQDESVQIPEGEADALAKSLPDWSPFPDVPPALAELRDRGWMLALLSNTDRDLIEASQRQLGVPVDLAIVAEDVGSYKPAHGALGALLRGDDGRPRVARPRRSEPLPRHRAGPRARPAHGLDQPARRAARARAGPRADRPRESAGHPRGARAGMTVVRPAREEDVEAAAEMLNEHSRRLHGTDDMTPADLLLYWTSPDVELGHDVLLAESPDGRLGGYADLGVHGDAVWLDVRGTDPATLPVMLEAIEQRAITKEPDKKLWGYTSADDAPLVELFERTGYRRARHSFRMRIDLDGDQSGPEWPDGVSVRTMREGEERRVYDAQMASFADTWMFAPDPYDSWLHWMVEEPVVRRFPVVHRGAGGRGRGHHPLASARE